jgi:excisionase family DNA binding protein
VGKEFLFGEEAAMDSASSTSGAPGDDRLVYSVAEAGALLGISRAFAYELVARGELPVIRLGRRRLVPRAALLAFIGAPSSQPGASLE